MKSSEFIKKLNEEASGGATGSPSIAVSFTQEGNMPNEIIERQKTYSNQRTPGGPVKVKKAK
jgi:hypothetical protein